MDQRLPVHCGAASERLDPRQKTQREAARQQKPTEATENRTNQTSQEKHLCADSPVSSMRVLVVLPLLLCAVVHVDQVRAEVKAVKLCGREFLRAVVYTCGGSRWRRFPSEMDMEGDGEKTPLRILKPADLITVVFFLFGSGLTLSLDMCIQERIMQNNI